jgi:cytochrome b involved in lipid metabolism
MKYILGVLAVIIVAGGVWYVSSPDNGAPVPEVSATVSPAVSPAATPTPTATPRPTTTAATFTAAQVAAHASRTSCYTIIRGSVYDLTSYIDKHPGGPQKIMQVCGKDGSSLFEDQHGGSAPQENMLATLKIGTLAP